MYGMFEGNDTVASTCAFLVNCRMNSPRVEGIVTEFDGVPQLSRMDMIKFMKKDGFIHSIVSLHASCFPSLDVMDTSSVLVVRASRNL
jgi:hypothetical protein